METLASSKTLVEQTYDAILNAICGGTLVPGERLTQEDVAKRLNVSRQPVNTALLVLKGQGFVIETGRRGLAVAPFDPHLFQSIYEIRSAIEPLAVTLATPRLNAKTIAEGRALVEVGLATVQVSDPTKLIDADVNFHSFIYRLSGNPLIADAMRLNWHHLRRAMGEILRRPDRARVSWLEHAEIMNAMQKGNASKAAKLIQDHVVRAKKEHFHKFFGTK